jgi:hypothetical protein
MVIFHSYVSLPEGNTTHYLSCYSYKLIHPRHHMMVNHGHPLVRPKPAPSLIENFDEKAEDPHLGWPPSSKMVRS